MKTKDLLAGPGLELFPGVVMRGLSGAGLTVTRVSLQAGAKAPEHAHPHEQVSLLLSGRVCFWVDGEEVRLTPGMALSIPSSAGHRAEAEEDSALVEVFAPVREDLRRKLEP